MIARKIWKTGGNAEIFKEKMQLENERKEMEIKKFELGWRCDGFFNQLPSLNNSVGL